MKILKNNRGDTIVEIMLVISILSVVLTTAYTSAAASLRFGRKAQERTEAVEYISGQVDQLKYLASAGSFTAPTVRACIKDNTVVQFATFALGNEPSLDADGNSGFSEYPASCKIGTIPYHVFFIKDAADDRLYHSYVRWNRIGGGYDQIKISYRVFKS